MAFHLDWFRANCFHYRGLNFCTPRKCTVCAVNLDKCVDKYFVQSSSVVLFSFVILHNAILSLLFEICNTHKLVHFVASFLYFHCCFTVLVFTQYLKSEHYFFIILSLGSFSNVKQ